LLGLRSMPRPFEAGPLGCGHVGLHEGAGFRVSLLQPSDPLEDLVAFLELSLIDEIAELLHRDGHDLSGTNGLFALGNMSVDNLVEAEMSPQPEPQPDVAELAGDGFPHSTADPFRRI